MALVTSNRGRELGRTQSGRWALIVGWLSPLRFRGEGRLEDAAIVELTFTGDPILPPPYKSLPPSMRVFAVTSAPDWAAARTKMRAWLKTNEMVWSYVESQWPTVIPPFEIP